MAKLLWDQVGQREYETGASHGALYVQDETGAYGTGVAWNGLVAVRQSPDGAEETPIYADNIKYLALTSAENFKGTIEAYTYPDEYAECDGSAEVAPGVFVGQQRRKQFGLAYTTVIGNDTMGNDYGEKLHVIYQAKVAPSERSYETINETPSAITFSWAFSTTPVQVETEGLKPSAYISFDSTKLSKEAYAAVKAKLFGSDDASVPTLPTMDELIALAATPAPVG